MVVIEGAALAKAATSAATTALFKSATERVEKVAKGPLKTIGVNALALLQSYQNYLEDTNDRVSTFKTFANPAQTVSVLDHFVTTKFDVGNRKTEIDQDDLIEKITKPGRFVISATAGYGKSMVMRYIALSLYENPRGRIPIFLELRHLNRVSSPDILTVIHTTYRRISNVQIEALHQGMTAGAFALLLDGFDELNHELRPIIEAQILELAKRYPQCSIIISGRPDDRFSSWRSFTLLKILPMSKTGVIELLNKLDYDPGTKKRFITKIKKGLYEKHQSFLSTPLLAILMLLTYEQNANIPDKIHLFYSKAFETLFHKHDAMKEQYDRSRKSKLQIDEFEKVFSIFCLKTYVLEKTEFTKVELTRLLREALKYQGHSTDVDDYFFDIEEAVCLVMKEGNSYFFVHRSFQEYFTAVFLASCPETTRDEFVDEVASRYWDNVLSMLFDMAADQIEPSWVSRNIEKYLGMVSTTDPEKMAPIIARFSGMKFYKSSKQTYVADFQSGPFSKFIGIMRRFYPQLSYSGPTFDFTMLEQYVSKTWDNISEKNMTKFVLADDETIYGKEIPIDQLPKDLVEKTNILSLVNHEYDQIVLLKKGLTSDQKAKNDFLNKLFASKS